MPKSAITNVSFNEGASMMLDIEVKCLGDGATISNKFLGVSC